MSKLTEIGRVLKSCNIFGFRVKKLRLMKELKDREQGGRVRGARGIQVVETILMTPDFNVILLGSDRQGQRAA